MPTIQRAQLPFHPLLGRNVNHDSRSKAYRVQPRHTGELRAVRHASFIGILDQGDLGACTGMSGTAAIYRQPYTEGLRAPAWAFQPNEAGAIALYSAASAIDPFNGTYPPTDTGSDGLSIAKVLKKQGVISGYRWAFTLEEALAALQETPLITGLPWYNSMFEPDQYGLMSVDRTSGSAGGHEICVDEYVPADLSPFPAFMDPVGEALVGGPNSWGPDWGHGGRWYLRVSDWGALLAEHGDVTQFVPLSRPAPVPFPPDMDPDDKLWASIKTWVMAGHTEAGRAASIDPLIVWARETGRLK